MINIFGVREEDNRKNEDSVAPRRLVITINCITFIIDTQFDLTSFTCKDSCGPTIFRIKVTIVARQYDAGLACVDIWAPIASV